MSERRTTAEAIDLHISEQESGWHRKVAQAMRDDLQDAERELLEARADRVALVEMLRRVEPVVNGDVPSWLQLRADLAALLARVS